MCYKLLLKYVHCVKKYTGLIKSKACTAREIRSKHQFCLFQHVNLNEINMLSFRQVEHTSGGHTCWRQRRARDLQQYKNFLFYIERIHERRPLYQKVNLIPTPLFIQIVFIKPMSFFSFCFFFPFFFSLSPSNVNNCLVDFKVL